MRIVVCDFFQKNYCYETTQPVGKNFHPEFTPHLNPQQMLEMGVFGGKYITDCQNEFPKEWFINAKLSPFKKNPSLNFFGVDASLSLAEWQKKGWIYAEDPRGWFQWYCRYYMGRRIEAEDARQIKRWKAMQRHWWAVANNCLPGNFACRPRQRQALLHWAYDSRRI